LKIIFFGAEREAIYFFHNGDVKMSNTNTNPVVLTAVQQDATNYINSGLRPVPIPFQTKAPVIKDWGKLKMTTAEVQHYFPNAQMNIGVLNGEPSGVVDVDLDCDETVLLAPQFLPETVTFGRASKPVSHYIYKIDGAMPKTAQFQDSAGEMLVELRSTGSQTVYPPSVHPSGQVVNFTNSTTPLHAITGDDLLRRVKKLAVAALLLRNYPAMGSRQHFVMALTGYLLKGGYSESDTSALVGIIVNASSDDEVAMRLSAIQNTIDTFITGGTVTGYSKLVEIGVTDKDLVKVKTWLGLSNQNVSVVSSPANTQSVCVNPMAGFAPIAFAPDYTLDNTGLYFITGKNSVFVAGVIAPVATTSDLNGKNSGVKLALIDRHGRQLEAFLSLSDLRSTQKLCDYFNNHGFLYGQTKVNQLVDFLALSIPSEHLLISTRLGWQPNGGYLFADRYIGHVGSDNVIYQGKTKSPTSSKGTHAEWVEHIAKAIIGNDIPMYVVMQGLTAPFVELVGLEPGGTHIVGESSTGKTATAQIGVSVQGCGSRPNDKNTAIQGWNTTANAMELVSATHHNLFLVVDELGVNEAKNFGTFSYKLASGVGKTRMTGDLELRDSYTWSNLIFSTGEISIQGKIESSGDEAKAGQLVRFNDIHAPAKEVGGLFPDTKGIDGGIFVSQLQENTAKYYGTATPMLIEALVTTTPDHDALIDLIKNKWQVNQITLTGRYSSTLNDIQKRAAKRFALVQTIGELAVDHAVLPYSHQQVETSVHYVFNNWLTNVSNVRDIDRALEKLRNFIESNIARFFDEDAPTPSNGVVRPPHNFIGYIKSFTKSHKISAGVYYLLNQNGFEEACEGFNYKQVQSELFNKGFLIKSDDQFKFKHIGHFSFPDNEGRRYYTINAKFLGDAPQKPLIKTSAVTLFEFDENHELFGTNLIC
jgi:uncharacterized protein (DUF927 family)